VPISTGSACIDSGISSGCTAIARSAKRVLELLVQDPLVRRVHVDDHEALCVLRQHIDAMDLAKGEAKRLFIRAVKCRVTG
jgi:hypothetical protein